MSRNADVSILEYERAGEDGMGAVSSRNSGLVRVPFFGSRVQAGFPSPADDFVEEYLDLNRLLVRHREATFFVRVAGDSMIGAGIHSGDILVVDRSLEAMSGKIVIAIVDGELTVKRLYIHEGSILLKPENPDYPDIPVTAGLEVWGVVTSVIHMV
jgi:DNA polymerase V